MDRGIRAEQIHDLASNQKTEWLNLIEAGRYVNKSPRFMRRLVADRRITHYKHGQFLAFRKSDLDEWATSSRREAIK